jgi:tRNA nucleotidyltransferase (CCA-adding enzyme)
MPDSTPIASDLMSAPVRTIDPDTTTIEAQKTLRRYGHSALPIVDRSGVLVGIIARRDLEIAVHHGFGDAAVTGHMTTQVRTITPDTTLPEIQTLLVTYDIGRLPVLADGKLVGIVTRTDVLRKLDQHRKLPILLPALDFRQLEDRLAPQLWKLLMAAAQAAQQWGWHLYLVGGAVRDLLLTDRTEHSLIIQDIDLVVDGCHQAAAVGAGVKLANVLQELYPAAHLDIHGAFQTAALQWNHDREFGSLGVDIATARTEFYAYPAANPVVEASSIRQDLYRRDFTINAMAFRLTPATEIPLLDFFGGLEDLQAKQIRVLHPNSFIEDPTRIYRGVRFTIRLGFQLETQTANYIRYAIDSGIYDRTTQANQKTPALQTRLKTELKYLLQSSYWQPALELLADLGALQCIHSTLKLDRELLDQLRLLAKCLRKFDAQQTLIHWQLRLELIIAYLAPADRQQVAKNLQLSDDSIARLQNLDLVQSEIESSFPNFQQISQIVKLLSQYDLSTLILIAVRCRSTKKNSRQIWQYLTIWMHVQPILTGNDLRELGYKPGPQYREILANLLAATLDGAVTDRSSAEQFLRQDHS